MAGKVSDSVQRTGKFFALWQNSNLGSEQLGLKSGLLVAVLFPTIMLLGLVIFKKKHLEQ